MKRWKVKNENEKIDEYSSTNMNANKKKCKLG